MGVIEMAVGLRNAKKDTVESPVASIFFQSMRRPSPFVLLVILKWPVQRFAALGATVTLSYVCCVSDTEVEVHLPPPSPFVAAAADYLLISPSASWACLSSA
jgi:hypothetical protein